MSGIQAGYVRLFIHDDKDTPQDFVIGLLRSVFSHSVSDAIELMATIEMKGKAVCGTYPHAVAEALFRVSQERIQASGNPLVMTAEAGDDLQDERCKLCGDFAGDQFRLASKGHWFAPTAHWRLRAICAISREQDSSTLPVPPLSGTSPVFLGTS